jgi:uncharacterized protein (TIGR02118 family)
VLKVVFVARKRPDLSVQQFAEYWTTTHADLVQRIPGVCRYVISLPIGRTGPERDFDGVAEVGYESMDALRAAADAPETAAVLADEPNLFDVARCVRMVTGETRVVG